MDNIKDEEIDLVEILKKIYKSRKFILIISFSFALIGVAVAMLSPIKFSSETIFITQNQESNSSSLSGVASLVGINLGTSNFGGEIPSSMYPQVTQSPKFKRLLLNSNIDFDNKINLKQYLIDYYKLNTENDKINSDLYVSELENTCFEIINEIISVNVNQKDGFITLSSTLPVAEYSAILTKKAKEILQEIIINNKIESAKQNLIFSQQQLEEKKLIFDEIQAKLAYFSDSNLNSVNSFVINERDKLEAEFQIINAVVTELSKQVEQVKLQVSKDTPVFSTIKEAVIPNKRTSPKRTQLVIIYGFIGVVISTGFILTKDILFDVFKEVKSK
jgi:LPS O-antigen subunit length determinant protein (WzzB/FepE family)